MRIRQAVAGAVAAALLVGCGTGPAPTSPGPASPTHAESAPPSPSAAGSLPVIVDTDLSVDDWIALMVVLRDPAVDVRAIVVDGTGLTHCAAGQRNVRALLAAFGSAGIPIGCGRELPGPNGREFPADWRAASDALYGVGLPAAAASEAGRDAIPLIAEAIASSPVPVTILALGPWTNLADAFAADPSLVARVAGIHAMAGAIDVEGNVELGDTALADGVEWNVGADPEAFAAVLALDVPVTLVPLDATSDVPVPADIVARLESDHAAAGADIAYEIYVRNAYLAAPGNDLWDPVAALTLTAPDLATWDEAAIAVTPAGAQAGRLVRAATGRGVRFARDADAPGVYEALFAGLRRGAPRPQPFELAGTLRVRWTGEACLIEGPPPAAAGVARIELANEGTAPVYLLVAGVRAPRTWADLMALLPTVDLGDPELVIPDWVVPTDVQAQAGAGASSTSLATLPAGLVGVACAVGEFPDFTFTDGGSFAVGE